MNNITTKENKFLNEKYYYIKHKSGLDIYVFPKKLTTSYALLGTKYGSIDNKFKLAEDTDYTIVPDGIAHFLEHKMFENENGEDTFLRYSRTGASANAYTSFTRTAYLFSCTDKFYDSLEILLDFVSSPYFTPETVKKEQGIIGQEIRMYEDNPGWRLMFGLMGCMYEKHNVRLDIAGTIASISEITADVLYKCYNTFYNLSNMALCVCGDVATNSVLEIADKVLKVQNPIEITRCYDEEKPEVFKDRFEIKLQVSKPLFDIGIKDVDISKCGTERMKKSAQMNILNEMLFGKTSEFYNSLYETGLISSSFGADFEHNKSFSFNSISGESKDPNEVYRLFCEYIKKTKINGLCEKDFERCKRVLFANMVKCFDSTNDIANDFLNYIFEDGDMLDFVDIINGVTYNDVVTLFNKFYRKECYAISIVLPLE